MQVQKADPYLTSLIGPAGSGNSGTISQTCSSQFNKEQTPKFQTGILKPAESVPVAPTMGALINQSV